MVTLNDCNGGADFFYDLEKSISLFEIGTDVFKIFKNKAPEKGISPSRDGLGKLSGIKLN